MESPNGQLNGSRTGSRPRADRRVAAGVAIMVATVAVVSWRLGMFSSAPAPRAGAVLTRDDPAPELTGLSRWFNSPRLTLKDLRGKVVLIDFWTYTCVNCVRTFPEIRALHTTYGPMGLVVIGVHSPEFNFEKSPANVERATREKDVIWPVAMDNDLKTWRAFDNHYWPHVYLIDHRGNIRFDHIGEGGGDRIEAAVRALLRARDPSVALPPPVNPKAEEPSAGITPEIYLGYERGRPFLGNEEGFTRDKVAMYELPGDESPGVGNGRFYLGGPWRSTREAVVSAKAGAVVVVPFTARNVFVVAGAPKPARVEVILDGKTYSTINVSLRDLMNVVRLPQVESHDLALRPLDTGVEFFTFTFG